MKQFPQYHFMIVKSHSIWSFDCGSWDYQEMKVNEKHEINLSGQSNVKLCTSPSDDERVITRIIRAYNHNMRK